MASPRTADEQKQPIISYARAYEARIKSTDFDVDDGGSAGSVAGMYSIADAKVFICIRNAYVVMASSFPR